MVSENRVKSNGRCLAAISRRRLLGSSVVGGVSALLAACGPEAQVVEKIVTVDRVVTVEVERVVTVEVEKVATAEAERVVTIQTEVPAPRLPFEGVEIEFRFNGLNPAGQEAARAEIVNFKELSGITVKPDFSDWASSFQKITTGFAAQSAPDIWYGGGLWTPVLAAKGQVLEIDEYVNNWDEWSDYYPAARADVAYNGQIYGVPYRTNYRGSPVIRASLFEIAGLEVVVPSTWDELNAVTQQLTIRDGDRYEQAGVNVQHHTHVYEDWLFQAGGNYFSEDRTMPLNLSPEGIAALSQHVRHGLIDETMPKEGMDSGVPNLHAFCAGRVAYQQLWPGNVGNCETNAPDVFADLFVGEPLKGPKERVMQIYVDKYMPWKFTKNPDATFATMQYFASPGPNYEINVVGDRSMPCRVAMESYEIYRYGPYRAFAQNVRFVKGRQTVPEHFYVQPAMSRWVEKAALGELTVQEALEGMDAEVTEIITGRPVAAARPRPEPNLIDERELFYRVAVAEDSGDHEAFVLAGGCAPDNSNMDVEYYAELANELIDWYRNQVLSEYGVSEDQWRTIVVKGITENWPLPPVRLC